MKVSFKTELLVKLGIDDTQISESNYVDLVNLIRSIQRAEGYMDCYRRGLHQCDRMDFVWRDDCPVSGMRHQDCCAWWAGIAAISDGLIYKDRGGRRNREAIMPEILVLGEQPQFRTLLSESLWLEGHLVETVADAAMLWDHLGHTQPDLVLLDANSDGFGTMHLFQDLKQQFPDLGVIVYQLRNYGDVERIKGAIDDVLESNTAPEPDKMLGSKETTIDNQPSAIYAAQMEIIRKIAKQ